MTKKLLPYQSLMSQCIWIWNLPFLKNFWVIYLVGSASYISVTPFIAQIFFCLIYRLHGTQNDRLEPTVSAQKSVLKNIDRVPRYQPKCVQNRVAKPNLHIFQHFGLYLRTRCIFFKTDFCVETVSSSRSF